MALFLADLGGGGAERMMVNLAVGFSERGVATDLVLADASGPYLADVPTDVRLVPLNAGSVVRAIPGLARYLRSERPDILLTTLHHASVVSVAAARLARAGTRVFIREANTPSEQRVSLSDPKTLAASWLVRFAYRHARGVVAVSRGVADDLRARRGVPPERIAVLYNPVVTPDLPELAARDVDHPWLADPTVPVILSVGRLHPQKDLATALRAFVRVRRARPARWIVLGEGPERSRLEASVRSAGVASDVDMPGFVDNPFAYMARASVFASSSLREGLPGAMIQALACGCPVVATDCPSGPAEVLEHGRYGVLVDVGDDEALARGILATLEAPPAGETLRAASRRFDRDRIVAAYLDHFAANLGTDGDVVPGGPGSVD